MEIIQKTHNKENKNMCHITKIQRDIIQNAESIEFAYDKMFYIMSLILK